MYTFRCVGISRIPCELHESKTQLPLPDRYGSITKHDRIKLGLDKSHVNDVFVIAGAQPKQDAKAYRSSRSDATIVPFRPIAKVLSRPFAANAIPSTLRIWYATKASYMW
ncbi:MAG: hypothetical protein ACFFC7_08085 [Candidatus Hermodarchaeota archaeon]